MIIICPSCEKKFEVVSNLIPKNGRLLKCGSCDQTWFFNKNDQINSNEKLTTKPFENKKTTSKTRRKINQNINIDVSKTLNNDISKTPNNKGSELVKYEPKTSLTFVKFLNYFIVLIISFVAVIITLDTFKGPLSTFFPNIELILYNLFETLKDLILFIKDLK